jgi:ABC-type cobalamin/Fe3+-siderophores transport system ATPase subunit
VSLAKGNANAATIVAIMGASGSGKTSELRKRLAKRKRRRTIIWSPKEAIDNYAAMFGGQVVTKASEVLALLKAAGSGPVHIVFRPRLDRAIDEAQFGAVCQMAMLARNVTFIADELHTVTRPSWAPDGWRKLVMMGRGYGAEVFGLSQRPASIDKDFLGNVSAVHVRRLAYEADAKAVASALAVPAREVLDLTGYMWIERDMNTGKVTRGS